VGRTHEVRPFSSRKAGPQTTPVNHPRASPTRGNTAAGIIGAGPVLGRDYNSFYGPWIDEIDLGLARAFHLTEHHMIEIQAQVFNLFNHANYFVQAGAGINQTQYNPVGATCGDGATLNQTCFLVQNASVKDTKTVGLQGNLGALENSRFRPQQARRGKQSTR
jgi:hypothetical protein